MTPTTESAAIPASDSAPRCQYRSPSGRQCRSSNLAANSQLCPRHSAGEKQSRSEDLTGLLRIAPDKFHSAAAINGSLGELFTLLAGDRVSARRAAVLAYISSLLLRSLPAIEKQAAGEAPKKVIPRFIWDLPCPPREYENLNPAGSPAGTKGAG